MSDEPKPTDAPTPPADDAAKEAPPAPERRPERGGGQPEKHPSRREKPKAPVRWLQQERTVGFGQKVDKLDDDTERDRQEAMSGVDEKAMYGEPVRGKRSEPQPGPKKGRVFRIHGQ